MTDGGIFDASEVYQNNNKSRTDGDSFVAKGWKMTLMRVKWRWNNL